MNQISPSVTNPTIAGIYKEIKSGGLILQPDFQRKFVWTHDHQQEFIDTILKGLPFPEIYVSDGDVNIDSMFTTKNVLDGQQRLTTILNYIEDEFDEQLTLVKRYHDLSDDEKKSFISYKLVVRDLGRIDDITMREVFRRINLTKFSLDTIEIQNALYDGAFIKSAKTIASNIDLTKYGVFRESEFTRMADLHFILLVMTTIENKGYFAQDKYVEQYVAEYNDNYTKSEHMITSLINTFTLINKYDLPFDSMWFRKSNFFSLVVEMTINAHRIPDDFRNKLVELESNVMDGKVNPSSLYHEYYMAMFQGTHNRGQRLTRGKFIKRYCFNIL